jgi:hypothetical protein
MKEGICHTLLDIATNSAVAHSGVAAFMPTSITMHAAYTLSQLCYSCRADWMANILNRIRSVWRNCSRDLQYVLCSITNRNDTAAAAAVQDTTQSKQRSRSPVRRSHYDSPARNSDHTEPAPARRTHYEPSRRRSRSYSRSHSRSRSSAMHYNYKRSGSGERQQQRRRRRSMSADSMRRYRSRSHSRRVQRSVSVTARRGSSFSDRTAATTAAAAAAAAQWSEAQVPLATDSGSAAAMALAAATAATPSQDYPMKVLEFAHVHGHTATATASTNAAEFDSIALCMALTAHHSVTLRVLIQIDTVTAMRLSRYCDYLYSYV